MRVDRLKCWSSVHEGGPMKDPPYMGKKRRYDASSGSRNDLQSHKYIAGTGGVAEKADFETTA
ncbi:unnamed protein product [Penicillium camemberti]|uniref:Str. FM013 n=1 Tax=Penicillium camemberti (strain FM 013) TaxID=1429867 RepID=A0A0G4PJJ0_PENC3|nr:unnamed protein product [Penicillium camemberti]